MLVLDVPSGTLKVTEELWLGARGAKRFMAWGRLDEFLTAVLPAKDLRTVIRVKDVAWLADAQQGRRGPLAAARGAQRDRLP